MAIPDFYIAEQFADVGPVLLLDMGVVVFLVRAAARELDLPGLAVVPQVLIDEFRAGVRVDPAQPEGQRLPELLEGRLDGGLPFAEDGGCLPTFDGAAAKNPAALSVPPGLIVTRVRRAA